MCGLLVAELLAFLDSRKVFGVPSQATLAKRVGANAGSFGKFLIGEPSQNPGWLTRGRDAVLYILSGESPDTPSTGRQEVLARINEYFFRDFDPAGKAPPPFFLPERVRFGEPCSRTELADEIEWFAAERQMTGREAKLVWVSGESTFFPDGATGTYGRAVHDAVAAGVQTRFVYYGPSPAAAGLDEFSRSSGEPIAETLRRMDTADPGATLPERWWEFLNPVTQYLFLSIAGDGINQPDEILFQLRAPDGDRRVRYGPIAQEANAAELTSFKRWLRRMRL
jgi:hypothetical protein